MSRMLTEGRSSRRTPRAMVLATIVGFAALGLAACDPSPVVVRGTITSPNGTPLGEVEVALFSDEDTKVTAATTDGFGEFEIRASTVPDGTYRTAVNGAWWPAGSSWDDAAEVRVIAGRAVGRVEGAIDPVEASVSGYVVDEWGVDQPGALVALIDDEGRVVSLVEAELGRFDIEVLRAGSYRLVMASDHFPAIALGGDTPEVLELDGATHLGAIDLTTGERSTA